MVRKLIVVALALSVLGGCARTRWEQSGVATLPANQALARCRLVTDQSVNVGGTFAAFMAANTLQTCMQAEGYRLVRVE